MSPIDRHRQDLYLNPASSNLVASLSHSWFYKDEFVNEISCQLLGQISAALISFLSKKFYPLHCAGFLGSMVLLGCILLYLIRHKNEKLFRYKEEIFEALHFFGALAGSTIYRRSSLLAISNWDGLTHAMEGAFPSKKRIISATCLSFRNTEELLLYLNFVV